MSESELVMDRKAITALIVGCGIDEFLVYRDEKELGTVAVGPDGRKYRLSNDQLAAAEKEAERKAKVRSAPKPEEQPAPAAPAAEAKPPAKPRRRTTTRKTTSPKKGTKS
jgi:hypothetical protein